MGVGDRKMRRPETGGTLARELFDSILDATRKTSQPSHSRASAALRMRLTGVRENVEVQGWTSAVALPHFCWPPDQYPDGCGPGSRWTCRCGAVWEAQGAMLASHHPTSPSRSEAKYMPEQWFYLSGGNADETLYRHQEPYYDWRPLGPYFVRLARGIIDNQNTGFARMSGDLSVPAVHWEDLS